MRAANFSSILIPEPGKGSTEKENQTIVLNLQSLDTGVFMMELQEGPLVLETEWIIVCTCHTNAHTYI